LEPSRASFQDFHSIEGLLSTRETPTRKPAAVPEQSHGDLVTRTVKKGDTLNKLISAVYGFTGKEVTDLVRAKNPNIRDVDVILPGEEIVFPIPPKTESTDYTDYTD
jgi:nucleoid-associated protein YgaU